MKESRRQEWQRRRGRFNHDWLKNVYLTALEKWLNVLDDRVEDAGFEREFLRARFQEWVERRTEARDLIRAFEAEMSPVSLFESPPLSRCSASTHAWLGAVVHAIWLHRSNAPEIVREAQDQLGRADWLFESLSGQLKSLPGATVEDIRSLRLEFVAFYTACSALAGAISRLPNRLRVV